MKKIVLLFVIIATVSFIGCGNNSLRNSNDSVLQQMVDDSQDTIEAMREAFGNSADIEVKTENNSLVYSFKYLNDITNIDALKDSFEKNINDTKETYESYLQRLKNDGIENPSVIIEYLDRDGNLIYGKEFK